MNNLNARARIYARVCDKLVYLFRIIKSIVCEDSRLFLYLCVSLDSPHTTLLCYKPFLLSLEKFRLFELFALGTTRYLYRLRLSRQKAEPVSAPLKA